MYFSCSYALIFTDHFYNKILLEEIFLKSFQRTVGIEKRDDGSEVAIMSSDPKDFGVTWTQIKAEMDKL